MNTWLVVMIVTLLLLVTSNKQVESFLLPLPSSSVSSPSINTIVSTVPFPDKDGLATKTTIILLNSDRSNGNNNENRNDGDDEVVVGAGDIDTTEEDTDSSSLRDDNKAGVKIIISALKQGRSDTVSMARQARSRLTGWVMNAGSSSSSSIAGTLLQQSRTDTMAVVQWLDNQAKDGVSKTNAKAKICRRRTRTG